jgi:hypothetical protein
MAAYDSLHSLLDYECLLFHCDEWWTKNICSLNHWTPIRVESYVTTDGQSASQSWNKAPIWGIRPDFYYCQAVAGLLMWGALSDERMGLSFTIAAGAHQRSHSSVRVLWDSRQYFTVPEFSFRRLVRLAGLRWRYSTPPPHGRLPCEITTLLSLPGDPNIDHHLENFVLFCFSRWHGNVFTEPLPKNGLFCVYSLPRERAYRTVD